MRRSRPPSRNPVDVAGVTLAIVTGIAAVGTGVAIALFQAAAWTVRTHWGMEW